jgi:hypothetical protein
MFGSGIVPALVMRPILSKLGFIRRAETFDSIQHATVLLVPYQQQNRIDEYIQRQSGANIGGSGHIRGFHHSFSLHIMLPASMKRWTEAFVAF